MKAGALRGDNIPVKISIHHNKPIKSLNGIILTLHRQTRFEPPSRDHPPLKKAFSAAGGGACGGTFRKDLAQTVLPLIVDPKSMTTVVKANLRVPEDVFPTIVNVPGGGVSFRYYVEVVVDLGGKLSSKDDFFKGGTSIPGLPRPGSGGEKDASSANAGIAVEGGVMVETERIRREKRIVFCRFEVVIGSVDSVGGKGRRGGVSTKSLMQSQTVEEEGSEANDVAPSTPGRPSHSYPEGGEAPSQTEDEAPEYFRHEQIDGSLLPPLPPDGMGLVSPMDEKTHLALIEQQLLPSAPPMDPSSAACPFSPSAPPSGGENIQPADQPAEDDKLEMERQRLLQATSAPPEESGESSEATMPAPSAPIIRDEFYEGPPRYVQ